MKLTWGRKLGDEIHLQKKPWSTLLILMGHWQSANGTDSLQRAAWDSTGTVAMGKVLDRQPWSQRLPRLLRP